MLSRDVYSGYEAWQLIQGTDQGETWEMEKNDAEESEPKRK